MHASQVSLPHLHGAGGPRGIVQIAAWTKLKLKLKLMAQDSKAKAIHSEILKWRVV
jgi:hypothetical protein